MDARPFRGRGGFVHDSNADNDDLPYMGDVAGAAHVVLAYASNNNDMRFFNRGGFTFADDLSCCCCTTLDHLYREGADAPRMLSIVPHLRNVGRPARIGGIAAFFDYALSLQGVWFARHDEITHHRRIGFALECWTARPDSGFGGTGR